MEVGADAKAESKDGRTPLHLAAQNGHLAVVNRLMEVGADPNHRSNFGSSPFHWAAYHGRIEILQAFRESGDPWLLDGFGRNVLDWASLYPQAFLAMGNLRQHWKPTDRVISSQHLTKTVENLLQLVHGNDVLFGPLGHLLLHAEDDVEATTAFEQRILSSRGDLTIIHYAECNMCGINPIQGPRYACRVCPDTDFCDSCSVRYGKGEYVRACFGHTFLKIPSQTWESLRPLEVNEAGETLGEWLERLKRKWNTSQLCLQS
jgi:hypothetical protein